MTTIEAAATPHSPFTVTAWIKEQIEALDPFSVTRLQWQTQSTADLPEDYEMVLVSLDDIWDNNFGIKLSPAQIGHAFYSACTQLNKIQFSEHD